jgi:hypothetical protein
VRKNMEPCRESILSPQIAKLVQDMLRNPQNYQVESKKVLKLAVWTSDFDSARYRILCGKVKEVVLKHKDVHNVKEVAIIPLTPTVILYEEEWNFDVDSGELYLLYVFTFEHGWRVAKVKKSG